MGHAKHQARGATCLALVKLVHLLLDAFLGLLELDLAGRRLCVFVGNLVLVDTRRCFSEELPARGPGKRRCPVDPAIASCNGKARGVRRVVGARQFQDCGRAKCQDVVAPFICVG